MQKQSCKIPKIWKSKWAFYEIWSQKKSTIIRLWCKNQQQFTFQKKNVSYFLHFCANSIQLVKWIPSVSDHDVSIHLFEVSSVMMHRLDTLTRNRQCHSGGSGYFIPSSWFFSCCRSLSSSSKVPPSQLSGPQKMAAPRFVWVDCLISQIRENVKVNEKRFKNIMIL